MDELERVIDEKINSNNYTFYRLTRNQFIKVFAEINYLLFNTDLPFINIIKSHKLGFKLDYIYEDMFQYLFKVNLMCYDTDYSLDKIKERTTLFDDIEERMLFRTELYKEGWNVEQIERYISRYILKREYPKVNLDSHKCLYDNIFNKRLKVLKRDREFTKGRPPLPPLLKEYVRKKHNSNNRDNMRAKYKNSKEYASIRVFTKNEIDKIKELIKEDTNLLKKIESVEIHLIV